MPSVVEDVFEDAVFEDAVWTGVQTDVIDHLDLSDKHIHLRLGVTEYHPVDDIYREVRFHRAWDESLRVVDMPVQASGNVDKGGGKFTSRLAIFNDGWRVVPANESHVLKVTGEQISDTGQSGVQIMDLVDLDPGVNVSIEYAPPDTEVVNLSSLEDTANAVWAHASATQLLGDVSFLKGIEGGRWEIVSNQMVFYGEDNTSELARFDLTDAAGNPAETSVFQRRRV